MTVLVGVLCTDGVVIGADSAMTHAAGVQPVMKVTGGVKLETPFNRFITATTGPVGLGQRFHQELHDLLQEPTELDKWVNKKPPIEFVTKLAQVTIENLKKTLSPHQQHPQIGWEFGALLGFASKKHGPQLVEFDQLQFHPELKGVAGPDGALKSKPFATMGSGQPLADPFIAHAHRVLFGESTMPNLKEGRLLVTWTLQHVLRYATGLVGGDLCIAQITLADDKWAAATINVEEAQQQVQEIETYIGQFGEKPDDGVPVDLTELAKRSAAQ